MWTRRMFLGSALTASLLPRSDTWAAPESVGMACLREAVGLGRRLRQKQITALDWQVAVEKTLRRCKVTELHDAIGLTRIRTRSVRRGASIVRVPAARHLCTEQGSDVKLFVFKKGRSDPPHCHFNMVSAHIVLQGRFRIRHYDRIKQLSGGVILKPTRDRVIGPGAVTSISDMRDNAHWHVAEADGVLLSIQQGRLNPRTPIRRRQNLDIDGGRKLADGTIFTPHLSRTAALRKYG